MKQKAARTDDSATLLMLYLLLQGQLPGGLLMWPGGRMYIVTTCCWVCVVVGHGVAEYLGATGV